MASVLLGGRCPLARPPPAGLVSTASAASWLRHVRRVALLLVVGLYTLQGLASSHVGLSLAGDVIIHALLRSPSCPLEVASQEVGHLVHFGLAQSPSQVFHQRGYPSTVCYPARGLACNQALCCAAQFLHQLRSSCISLLPSQTLLPEEGRLLILHKGVGFPPQVGIPSFVRPTAAVVCSAVPLISISRCFPHLEPSGPGSSGTCLFLGRLRYHESGSVCSSLLVQAQELRRGRHKEIAMARSKAELLNPCARLAGLLMLPRAAVVARFLTAKEGHKY